MLIFIKFSEEEKLKNLEKSVSQLAEESCFAAEENDKQTVSWKESTPAQTFSKIKYLIKNIYQLI